MLMHAKEITANFSHLFIYTIFQACFLSDVEYPITIKCERARHRKKKTSSFHL